MGGKESILHISTHVKAHCVSGKPESFPIEDINQWYQQSKEVLDKSMYVCTWCNRVVSNLAQAFVSIASKNSFEIKAKPRRVDCNCLFHIWFSIAKILIEV